MNVNRAILLLALVPAGCADELNTPQNVVGGQEPAQNAPEAVEPNGAAPPVADSDTPPQTIVYAPLKVGDDAPSFVVTDMDGGPISLAHYYGKQNVVLVFSGANATSACIDQLVQLQEKYADFQDHGTEVIIVFREDDSAEGLARSRDQAHAEFPLALDVGAVHTSAYSRAGYQTYVIDREGIIRAVLDGTEDERPTAEEILSEVEELPTE